MWADTDSPSQLLLEGKRRDVHFVCPRVCVRVSVYVYRCGHTVSLITWRALFCTILTQCGRRRVFQLNVIFLGIALYKMFHHTAILKPDSGCLDNIK